PAIPIIAEEAAASGDIPLNPGPEFLLVDPLDGTREFVDGRREFTVNIALDRDSAPVRGVVYAPASGILYSGQPGSAQRLDVEDHEIVARRDISVRRSGPVPIIVTSRSHRTEETDIYLAALPQAEIVSIGSSLKFGMLAA